MTDALPSQHDIIPNLGTLDRLLLAKTPADRVSGMQRQTEQLPYYLRGACTAIRQLEATRVEAVTVLAAPSAGPHTQVILPPDKVDPLSFAIDFYLFCARRAIDALVPYISRCPRNLSLPASMKDLAGGIAKSKYPKLDPQVQTTLLSYWEQVGLKIKGYRDQTSHKAIILSNCIAFNGAGGVSGLKMLLPDNPEEKRPSELRYEPGVPAMGFALDSLQQTIRLANVLVERMIDLMASDDPSARSTGIVSIAMRGAPLRLASTISGEPVPFPVNVFQLAMKTARDASRN